MRRRSAAGASWRHRRLRGSAAPPALVGCADDGDGRRRRGRPTAAAAPSPRYLRPFRGRAPDRHHRTRANAQGLLAAFTRHRRRPRRAGRRRSRRSPTRSERLMAGEPYEERDPGLSRRSTPAPSATRRRRPTCRWSCRSARRCSTTASASPTASPPSSCRCRSSPTTSSTRPASHGDLLLTISSAHEDINLFALRQLMRATRGTLALQWMLDGYNRRTERRSRARPGVRNLMGFVDGTANLDDRRRRRCMDRYVWVAAGRRRAGLGRRRQLPRRAGHPDVRRVLGPHPARRAGGADRPAQGRPARRSTARSRPTSPTTPPTPTARSRRSTPTSAWPTRAPPTTEGDLHPAQGLNFSRGFDGDGQLDQGLAFVCFQRRLQQFLDTQARLAGEPLEEYIEPQGGGFFFALPGVRRRRVPRRRACSPVADSFVLSLILSSAARPSRASGGRRGSRGQAERALGEVVALHLVGAAADRDAVAADQLGLDPRRISSSVVDPGRAGDRHGQVARHAPCSRRRTA